VNELYEKKGFRFIKVQNRNKNPVESNWQAYNNYAWDDSQLQKWIKQGGNVGIVTGFNNLVVIDFDDKEFEEEYLRKFPPTLTQESGSGGLHLFYLCDVVPESFKILDKEKNTLCDIQGKSKQIIVAPSTHPTGNKYKFINKKPIAKISQAEIKAIFKDYLEKETAQTTQISQNSFNGLEGKPILSSVLKTSGINISRNPTNCIWHASKGGKCFSFDDAKGLWHCFHCGKSGDVIKFVMERDSCNFKEACKKLDIDLKQNEKINDSYNANKERIQLTADLKADPQQLSDLIGDAIQKRDNLFYRPYFNEIVELQVIKSKEDIEKNRSKIILNKVDEDRFVNIICEYIYFYELKQTKDSWNESPVRLTKTLLSVLMKNDALLKKLRIIEKVLSRPYLFLNSQGLNVEYEGYSEKTNNYYTLDTPALEPVTVEDSKKELNKIVSGFCFEDESDKVMALAYIMTPALRGLYNDKRERTPCFALLANRERAGKDYLAGIRSILYTGVAVDHPPIADGERSNVEEWRKKFSSMMMVGQTIFHSANNIGYLNNPVFEAIITSKVFEDRLLGSNSQKILDNNMDVSFSANVGLRWRGDMSGRLRRINLFYAEEDPNSRSFPIPDLHGYIENKRGYILSCIYKLITDWYESGMPCTENKIFSSFPVWAKFCGGLMDYHNLGNPLVYQEDDDLSGNEDDRQMGALFEFMNIWQQNNNKADVRSPDIIDALKNYQELDENQKATNGFGNVADDILMGIRVASKGDTIKLGHMITRFKGRIIKGIKFRILQQNKEAKRRIYTFERI